MAFARFVARSRAVALFLGLAAGSATTFEARGDRIVLRGGGQIRGKIIPSPEHPDRITVLGETGKTPLSFQKAQVVNVIAEPSALDGYVVRRASAGDDAEAQYQLGLWCEEHKLADLAGIHYEAAVARDKSFGLAHQKLGHVLHDDHWLTADEVREVQGFVKYKGRWVSKDERDRREAQAALSAEQASWVRRIRLLREGLFGNEERRREAEQALLKLDEPAAVGPLVRMLGRDPAEIRMLLDQVLGGMTGPEATEALVGRILAETDGEVRQATMTELERKNDPKVIGALVRALGSAQPEVVNRAAWSLGQLDAVAVVPKLVPALITTQYRVVIVPPNDNLAPASPAVSPVPIYTNGSSTAYLTPPAVGPGVVAYGLTQAPYSPFGGVSLSLGGGAGASPSRGPEPKVATYSYQNAEVLATLVKLTGKDLGYDIAAWKRWVNTSFRPDPEPVRRVPQP